MEIVPGIHRVDGVRGANSYLIISQSSIMVIDTGMPGNARKIAAYITKVGRKPGDTSYIVLTHSDIDHSGSAAELKAITGARLGAHAGDVAVLLGKAEKKRSSGMLSPLFGMMRMVMRSRPVIPDIVLKEGDIIDGYEVVHSPGHTAGSISLYDSHDIIFVGDALRSDAKGNPMPPSRLLSFDMVRALDSVRKISNLEFSVLLPGHGAPVIQEASRRVKALLESNHPSLR